MKNHYQSDCMSSICDVLTNVPNKVLSKLLTEKQETVAGEQRDQVI